VRHEGIKGVRKENGKRPSEMWDLKKKKKQQQKKERNVTRLKAL